MAFTLPLAKRSSGILGDKQLPRFGLTPAAMETVHREGFERNYIAGTNKIRPPKPRVMVFPSELSIVR